MIPSNWSIHTSWGTSKAAWQVQFQFRWIGVRRQVSTIGNDKQTQLWLGFAWIERAPWSFFC